MVDTDSDNPRQDVPSDNEPDEKIAAASNAITQPDFNHEALAHLQVQSDEIFLHVQLFIDRGSERNRRQLLEYLKRFRNTLVLIEKIAAVYVVEELLTLMQADAAGGIANRSELARVLATAAEQLCDYVATLQQDTSVDSALPLLPLVNDSRACREESLISDTLVLAAGIELPVPMQAGLADGIWTGQRQSWVEFASSHHSAYARALLGWWRSGEYESIRPLVRVLKQFAEFCEQYDYLQVIQPLFQSAAIVGKAIEERELDDGPALRSMYAQLERNIHRCSLVATPDDLLPGDLLRNFLYYVAQTDSSSRTSLELRRQFRLDRIREAALVNQTSMTPTIGVGYHLATAIRAGIANETAPVYSWLKQATVSVEQPKVIRLAVRLMQLEPVLNLMGEPEALASLQRVNIQLQQLRVVTPATEQLKTNLLQSLQELDDWLDKSARRSITRGAGAVDRAAIDGKDVFVDMATDALLREARGSLRIAADDLALLFVNPDNDTASYASIIRHLTQINNALQILPLPEIDALITGLCDVLKRCHRSGKLGRDLTAAAMINNDGLQTPHASSANEDQFEADTVEQELARLLVSIDFYLGCVLQPQPAASQLLVEANDALDCARARIDGAYEEAAGNDTGAAATISMQDFLSPMDRFGQSLGAYRSNPESSSFIAMQLALADYRQIAAHDSESPNAQLATSAEAWLAKLAGDNATLNSDQMSVLEEVHALMPQLLDQSVSGTGPVPAFDELIQQLDDEVGGASNRSFINLSGDGGNDDALADPEIDLLAGELAFDPWSADSSQADISSLTLNVDDALLNVPTDSAKEPLDNTLQHLFYSECLGHLEILEESVRNALQPSADNSNRLPNEQMLRALHTLTSSAQTVDAEQILAIVQPLQRAALARQRLEQSFDASHTRYIGDLAVALRARLDALSRGTDVGQSVRAVEQKLDRFLESVLPGNDDDQEISVSNDQGSSLESVFTEEARELQDQIRDVVTDDLFGESSVEKALALLHTLKGSARMVGKTEIAQTVHALEAELREPSDLADRKARLRKGHQTIQSQLQLAVDKQLLAADASPEAAAANTNKSRNDQSLQVSDTAFESLLDLATDLTVNQARLSEELATLREAYQDIGVTAKRWQSMPRPKNRPESNDLNEMMADLEAARNVMRTALRQAEREQQKASRASANLQQSLVRTRLVRVDEMQERLLRTVQDACEVSGVKANLVVEGGELTLDRSLYRQLAAPLDHIARNAVVHGIESPEQRMANGKSSEGTLTLHASNDGTDLVIRFHDDGRGIDRESLNAAAIQRGEKAIETQEDLQRVLFSTGFSSVENAGHLAGHGLGLAAVKSVVEQMKGSVQLSTATGTGTILTLRIPQRMAVSQVVLVASGGLLYGIPVGFVDSVLVDGAVSGASARYQSLSIDALLSRPVPRSQTGGKPNKATVLVNVRQKLLAISIDQIIGYREFVTQALGPQMSSLNQYSGGGVLPDGRQVLILDMVKLADSLDPKSRTTIKPAQDSLRPVALIVDDSLTMRVAAENVLNQCGIAVRLARDGVEALESVDASMPNLVIVDLEMPRLDGMSLLRQLKQTYAQACPPMIIVSSRDDIGNRRLAQSIGVVRFLAKPFTESALLEAIEAAGLRIPDLTIA